MAKYENSASPASWCKVEYTTSDYKSVTVHEKNDSMPVPLLTIMSLSMHSLPGFANRNEISYTKSYEKIIQQLLKFMFIEILV